MIDEAELDSKIRSLKVVLLNLRKATSKTDQTLVSLKSLEQSDGQNPLDTRTGQTMSDATRQEIYDACASVADDLIAKYNSLVV